MLRWLPLIFAVVLVELASTSAGQQAATAGTPQRRYTSGAVSHYLMTGNNDGSQYTIEATDVVKRDMSGRYYEEIGWSDTSPPTLSRRLLLQALRCGRPFLSMTLPRI